MSATGWLWPRRTESWAGEREIAPLVETEYAKRCCQLQTCSRPRAKPSVRSAHRAAPRSANPRSARPSRWSAAGREWRFAIASPGRHGKKAAAVCWLRRDIAPAGDGKNQRAGIEQKRQLALAEQRLQFDAAGMQTIRVAIAVQRIYRQDGVLRQSQDRRADGGVIIVFRREGGEDEVVRVVCPLAGKMQTSAL